MANSDMNIVIAIVTLYCGIIFFLVFKYISSFNRYSDLYFQDPTSIIVAYRNESDNLKALIEQLLSQDHAAPYEIILINDHSTDDSLSIVNQFRDPRVISLTLSIGQMGKKAALHLGAKAAQGKLLLFTDADCSVKPQWLRLMSQPFLDPNIDLVAGPFLYVHSKGTLSFFQHFEQLLLWGFSKSMANINRPVMCNGANLAVRTESYLSLIEKIKNYGPSGDDIYLLQEIKRRDASAILYIDHQNAVISSEPTSSIKTLINQKLRWASKAGKISDLSMNISGLMFIIFNFYFLYLLLFGAPQLFFIKIFFELFFAATVYINQFGKIRNKLQWTCLAIFILAIYPFYSLTIALMSKIKGFEWKGRAYPI